MKDYLNFDHPAQSPLPGQVPNNAGGFSWQVDDMTRLYRLLIAGSASGTYYTEQQDLLQQNLESVYRLLKDGHGHRVVDAVVAVSEKGRAHSNDPALLILALCASCTVHGKVKRALPEVRHYEIHRRNHPALFEQFSVEGVTHMRIKNGRNEQMVRGGDVIYRTITLLSPSFVEEDHPEDLALRQYALAQLSRVARTGTHLLHFAQFVRKFRGWGPTLRKALQHWYIDMPEERLARQLLKYRERDGNRQEYVISHAHPKPPTETYHALFYWVKKGWPGIGDDPHPDPALRILWAYERAKRVTDEQELLSLIHEYKLSREMIPSRFLTSQKVWWAFLQNNAGEGLEWLVRNLENMTRIGTLMSKNDATRRTVQLLTDPESIKKSRLHPIRILVALTHYAQSKKPIPEIVQALDKAFRLAFTNVVPTGKKILLAIDVSGSMKGTHCSGLKSLTLHQVSAAIATVFSAVERHVEIIAVDTAIYPLRIVSSIPLDRIIQQFERFGGGGTNLGLVIEHALKRQQFFDCFVVLTDSYSWAGEHPSVLLTQYRKQINPAARMVTLQMVANHVTNHQVDDKRILDIVGFDTNVFAIMHAFIQGEI